MTTTYDTRLLGRRKPPPDARDYRLTPWLGDPGDPLTAALIAAEKSKRVAPETKAFLNVLVPIIQGMPDYFVPIQPQPVPQVTSWVDPSPTLDQEDTSHCVGFAGAQWGNTLPISDVFSNQAGHDIYYECKLIDGEPLQENGSDGRSLAKALRARGRLSTYAFAQTLDEVIEWVTTKGPLMMGSYWTDSMFAPARDGTLTIVGDPVGGHEYVCNGFDSQTKRFEFINSWGAEWGINGHFFVARTEYEKLWFNGGDALAAVELPAA